MEIIAGNNQSLLDIALITSGTAEAVYDLAVENGISVTDKQVCGQILRCGEVPINKRNVDYYTVNDIKPATSFKEKTYKIFDSTFDYTFE